MDGHDVLSMGQFLDVFNAPYCCGEVDDASMCSLKASGCSDASTVTYGALAAQTHLKRYQRDRGDAVSSKGCLVPRSGGNTFQHLQLRLTFQLT